MLSKKQFNVSLLPVIGMVIMLVLAGCSPAAGAPSAGEPLPTDEPTEAPTESVEATEELIAALTDEQIKNALYQGIYDAPVQLTDGQYQGEGVDADSASLPSVTYLNHEFGDLNGDGVADAVVLLVENSGGSGSFVYLAAVINEAGEASNVSTVLVGDGVQVESITVEGATIHLQAKTFAADDPQCCPSLEQTLSYTFEAAQLVSQQPASDTSDEGRIPAPPAELVGVWQWVEFEDFGEGTSIIVEDPTKYTIKFNDDNTYEVVADCNLSSGNFRALEGGIVIEGGPTTLAECGEGSHYDAFLTKLGAVATYVLQDGKLYLNLMMDSGNMVFVPAQ